MRQIDCLQRDHPVAPKTLKSSDADRMEVDLDQPLVAGDR